MGFQDDQSADEKREWSLRGEFRPIELPSELQHHPLIKDGVFYTLPMDLIDNVLKAIPEADFEPEQLALEKRAGESFADHTSWVGYWHGRPLPYCYLRSASHSRQAGITPEQAQSLGSDAGKQELRGSIDLANKLIPDIVDAMGGYCGWLVTNRDFLAEHDAFFTAWREEIAEHFVPGIGLPLIPAAPSLAEEGCQKSEAKGTDKAFIDTYDRLLCRWRLVGLAGPYLPLPAGPLLASAPMNEIRRRVRMGGTMFHLPDVFPVPDRDWLRKYLESVRISSSEPHLAEWCEFIRAGSRGRAHALRYARVFELQHFWRILYSRHRDAFAGQKKSLRAAVASFLSISASTIEDDLQLIDRRLGRGW